MLKVPHSWLKTVFILTKGDGVSTDITGDATHRAPENVSHDLAEKGVPGVKAVRPAP